MAHFAYTRTPGTWTALSALSHAEMEDIDTKLYKAINGDEGGAWTPSTAIQIGGAGFSFGGATGHRVISGSALYINSGAAFQASSGATFTLDNGVTVSVQAAFVAGGGGTLTGAWGFNGTHTVGATGALIFASGSEVTSAVGSQVALLIDGATSGLTWQNSAFCTWATGTNPTVDAGATLTIDGEIETTGTTTLGGTITCNEVIEMASHGSVAWRAALGTDANLTILADTTDEIYIPAGTLSAGRTYTLAGTPVEGQRFAITTLEGSTTLSFDFNGGSVVTLCANGTNYRHFGLTYIGGSWRRTMSVVT